MAAGYTIKPGTPEHGILPEPGTPAERRNNTGTRNNGTLSGGIRVRIPQELHVMAFRPWNLDVVVF